jgi:hypothetical protein
MNELKFRFFLLTLTVVLFAVGFTPLATQNVFADVSDGIICSSHCNENTLGVDSKGNRIVSNGISYNGYSVDVERYYTPYPLITVNVGETNKADFKIYDSLGPKNIRHFTLAFGLDKDQMISQSKVKIELDIDFDGTETVTVTDPENALDHVIVSTNIVSCSDDSELECLNVTIYHTFRTTLDFNIVATDIWNTKRYAWQNYYNHGIQAVGESLNPPKEFNGHNKGQTYHLTEIDKTIAVDENGNSWTLEYEQWKLDYISNEHDGKIPMGGYSREHVYFDHYKNGQLLLAQHILVELCKKCIDEPFGEINDIKLSEPVEFADRATNSKIREILDSEATKAEQKLEFLFESLYVAKVFD